MSAPQGHFFQGALLVVCKLLRNGRRKDRQAKCLRYSFTDPRKVLELSVLGFVGVKG